jgi:ribosome biogenesis SPOUT family RNA methylase Rps3
MSLQTWTATAEVQPQLIDSDHYTWLPGMHGDHIGGAAQKTVTKNAVKWSRSRSLGAAQWSRSLGSAHTILQR